MKWIYSNGRTLEVRDAGPVVFRLTHGDSAPLPLHDAVVEDAEARAILRQLLDTGHYTGGQVK